MNVSMIAMTQFDSHALAHLKKLCRIECSPDEEQDILRSFARVLGYVEALKEVPTDGVPPCNFVLRGMLKNVLREDEIQDVMSREQFFANVPKQVGGMVCTPTVMKHE